MNLIPTIVHWLVSGAAIMLVAKISPGFKVRDFKTAVMAAVVIGLLNALFYTIIFWLTLPLSIVTLGLFTFVIDAMLLKLCAKLMDGFALEGWTSAILTAILLSIVNSGLHTLFI